MAGKSKPAPSKGKTWPGGMNTGGKGKGLFSGKAKLKGK